jgi:hypothetical protein
MTRWSAAALLALAVASCKDGPSESSPPPPSAASGPPAKMLLVDGPTEGHIDEIVRAEMTKATAARRRVVAYVGATWCEPCQRFHHAAERGELDATFPNVELLGFDLDRDRERLVAAGYSSKLIPLFALPGPDGRASGKQVEGGIKGEGAVANIAPRLEQMLAE